MFINGCKLISRSGYRPLTVSKAALRGGSFQKVATPWLPVVSSWTSITQPNASITTSKRCYCCSTGDHKHEVARVGGLAPEFVAEAVVGTDIKNVKLTDYRGKWVVFFFYPLDFTFVCPTEIIEFSNKAKEFKQINTEVIAISCDSKFTHLAWINTPRAEGGLGQLDIPVVADFTKSIATSYGALFLDNGFPLRALYIIDPAGVIRQITLNSPPVGRNVEEVYRLVQAFQYTDKHGEVCPVNWKPGDSTINPAKKLEYFSKVYTKPNK